jgi:uncharacterized membrane protein YkvA (DUF1232 family)
MKEKDEMDNSGTTSLEEVAGKSGFWRELWQQIRLIYYLMRDPEVPIYLKLVPLLGVAYVIFPIDLIPDVAPLLGQLDDLTALVVGAKVFIDLAPPHIVGKYLDMLQQEMGGPQVVDGMAHAPAGDDPDPWKDAIIIDAEHEIIIDKDKTQE